MAKLFIHQLSISTIIGVLAEEKLQPQELLIDFEAHIDISQALATDALATTTDYTKVRQFIIRYISNSRYELLETLCGLLVQQLQHHFSFPWLRLTITKKPKDMPDIKGVGITVEWP